MFWARRRASVTLDPLCQVSLPPRGLYLALFAQLILEAAFGRPALWQWLLRSHFNPPRPPHPTRPLVARVKQVALVCVFVVVVVFSRACDSLVTVWGGGGKGVAGDLLMQLMVQHGKKIKIK